MDLLSHALVGGMIGEAVVGKRIGRRGMVIGAVTALLPDLDVLGHFFLPAAQQLAFHRGITHSLLVSALMPLLLAGIFRRWHRNADVSLSRWALLFGLSLASHLLLDVLTCYGTGLWEPFSHHRVALDTIFVADPFFTLPLLVVVLMIWLRYKAVPLRRRLNLIGICIGTAYLAFTCVNHAYMRQLMGDALAAQGLPHETFTVTPTPMNNLLWMGYSQDAAGAWIGYHSLLDADRHVSFHRLERQAHLLAPYSDDPALPQMIRLSKGNYAVTQDGPHVYFNDLRFGMAGSWDSLGADFAMRYDFAPGADNTRPLDRLRFSESYSTVFLRLWDRVLGKISATPTDPRR
jgi:inner membrane protein